MMTDAPMPNQVPLSSFRTLSDTDKTIIIWQGLTDTWNKLNDTIEHQKSIEADTKVHNKLLITGNGEPTLMERVRNLEKFQNTFEYWAKVIGGALLLNFIGFTTGILLAIFKFLPLLERLASQP